MAIEHGYQCKECGSPVMLVDGKIVRSCQHTGTVIATLSAHVTASGTVSNPSKPPTSDGL